MLFRVICCIPDLPGVTKTLRIMKLTALFLLVAFLHVSARSYSQKITLVMTDAPLEKVFVAIKAQTGYTFFYTEDELQHFTPVSITVKEGSLEDVLDRCFEHQAYSYTILDKMVVVRMKTETPPPEYGDTSRRKTIRVTGVINGETGQPLSGANVAVARSQRGVITDELGQFSIDASPGDVLVFSYVGMETQELKVGNQSRFSITLTKGNKLLEEVVVEGYGSAKKVGAVVGSISTVGAKDLQEKPVADVFDALQGKVPGLLILSSSGEPSSQVSISLNGIGSLSADATPLIVLDGVPVAPGTILSLNPADIESMNVLRDASATSIYGSRAANGVIYVTSRKGQPGRDVVNVQTQYGVSNLTDVKFFNQFMSSKQLTDFWVATNYKTQGAVDTLLQQYPNNTKWYKYYYRKNAPTYQTNVSLSGGTTKTTYYVSASYFKAQGLAYRSNYDRYTFRANLNSKVTPWLNMGLNLAGGYNSYETNPSGTNSTNRGLFWLAQPFYSPIDPTTGKAYPTYIPGWGHYAPNYRADNLPNPINTVQLNPQGYLELTPIRNLIIRSQAGIDGNDQRSDSIQLPSFQASPGNGNVASSFGRSVTEDINNTAEYTFHVGKSHNVNALVGQEYIDNKSSYLRGSSTGQTDDRLIQLGQGPNTIKAISNTGEYAYISYFGRVEYNYAEKYYLNVSGRQDESSLFGADKRNALFGSAGVMWQIGKEDFMQHVRWLTDAALRVNYGSSGNSAINNYQSLATVGTSQYDSQTGWNISTPGNPNLTWEKAKQTTIGAQFTLLARAHLDVDVYNKVTSSMLVSVPYPYTTGFSSITSNVGSLRNRGINTLVDVDIFKTRKALLNVHFDFNYNQEEVTKLFQGLNYWIIPNTGVCWVVGKPVSYFYPIFAQVNSQNGNPEWYVPNSDPNKIVVTNKDPKNVTTNFSSSALQQNTGIKRNPPFKGGFGLDGNYDGFFVSASFTFVGGKYIINNDQYFYDNPNVFTGYNQSAEILNYWKQPGDVTRFPAYGNQFTQFDSRLIQNASFIRLKVLTVGYTLPKSLLQRTGVIKAIKIYATGRNLLTFTKYPGVDPEIDANLTLGAYPNSKQFVGGLDIQF